MESSLTFENQLNTCIRAIQERGLSVEECLTLYPAQRADLEPLLRLVVRLQAARSIQAPPQFRQIAAERMRLMIAASPRRVRHPLSVGIVDRLWQLGRVAIQGRHVPRLAAALSLILIICSLVGTSAAFASAESLPGDPLYPLKIGIEGTQLLLATNDIQTVNLRITFAGRRLDEASILIGKKRSDRARTALVRYNAELADALAPLHDPSRLPSATQQSLADMLDARLTQQQSHIDALLAETQSDDIAARQALEQARIQAEQGRSLAQQLLGRPGNPPDDMPRLPANTRSATPTPVPSATPTMSSTPTPTTQAWPSAAKTPTPPVWPTWFVTPTTPMPWPTWQMPPVAPPRTPPGWPTWPILPTVTPGTPPPAWPTPVMWPTPSVWPTFPAWPTHPPLPTPPAHPTPPGRPTPRSWPTAPGNASP